MSGEILLDVEADNLQQLMQNLVNILLEKNQLNPVSAAPFLFRTLVSRHVSHECRCNDIKNVQAQARVQHEPEERASCWH